MSMTARYAVTGMSCEHCVNAVTTGLSRLAGVRDVQVDLASATVAITSDSPLPMATVRAAIDDAGYQLDLVRSAVSP